MKNDNTFIAVAASICLILLGVVYGVSLYELDVDWDSISGIILGVYLYVAYLLLNIICGKPKNRLQSFQRAALHGMHRKNPQVYRNDVYKY